MRRMSIVIVLIVIYLILDIYAFQLVKHAAASYSQFWSRAVIIGFWTSSVLLISGLLMFTTGAFMYTPRWLRAFFQALTIIVILPKLFLALFAFIDDVVRLGKWVASLFDKPENNVTETKNGISRGEFIAQAGMVAAAIPIVAGSYSVLSGAHDYRVRHRKIPIKNLPSSFEGLRIAQLSDIHSGSFWNKRAVQGGVEMLLTQKPDMIFFTGDLVNDRATEMRDYGEVFNKLKAPMGVFSTLGNHDYGDYVHWESEAAKRKNLQDLLQIERNMGWKPLMDENVIFSESGDKLAVIGIQNWSAKARFPKHGNLAKAVQGTEDAAVKLLLSHDPSHWRAQVLPQFGDIDLMLAGHTHGAQFGIETGNYRWSPVSMMYEEWADLYQENDQYLYVNRGFGYLGFPGRLGILPEITILELCRG
ncbi:metallophosphoesterase [bacterium]|nr:metallophosphoesterase [bacterium]